MNAGLRYEHCTLDNFNADENPAALSTARDLVEGRIDGLLLAGPAGRGKTHLLVGIGKAYEREGLYETRTSATGKLEAVAVPARTVAFWPVLELVGDLRGCMSDRADNPEPSCRAASLLLLDDFGAENTTDFAFEALQRIIDYRYRNRKPVAITTNLTIPEWIARYQDRMLSRLTEGGRIVQMKGRDRRPEMGR